MTLTPKHDKEHKNDVILHHDQEGIFPKMQSLFILEDVLTDVRSVREEKTYHFI